MRIKLKVTVIGEDYGDYGTDEDALEGYQNNLDLCNGDPEEVARMGFKGILKDIKRLEDEEKEGKEDFLNEILGTLFKYEINKARESELLQNIDEVDELTHRIFNLLELNLDKKELLRVLQNKGLDIQNERELNFILTSIYQREHKEHRQESAPRF